MIHAMYQTIKIPCVMHFMNEKLLNLNASPRDKPYMVKL